MLKKVLTSIIASIVLVGASMPINYVTAEELAEQETTLIETTAEGDPEDATDISSEDATEDTTEAVIEEETEEVTDVTPEEPEEEDEELVINYVYNNQLTVFDAIKMKRSLMSGETTYDLDDYDYVRGNLLRLRKGNVVYSKKVPVIFEKDGYPMYGYPKDSVLDSFIANAGGKISIPQHTLQREGASHGGWFYDGKNYIQGEEFIVPDVDQVVFTPYWFYYHKVTYLAGDYDDVVEYPSFTMQGTEGVGLELADSTRFTRPGYELIGWLCNLDGLDYGVNARYIVPDTDVVFTAIWEAAEIPLSISANNGVSTDKITDTVYVGDEFVFPECSFTNGDKTFTGWKYNKVIYQPGDKITIPALKPGLSVIITAQWS